jgi:hypothetical protein
MLAHLLKLIFEFLKIPFCKHVLRLSQFFPYDDSTGINFYLETFLSLAESLLPSQQSSSQFMLALSDLVFTTCSFFFLYSITFHNSCLTLHMRGVCGLSNQLLCHSQLILRLSWGYDNTVRL